MSKKQLQELRPLLVAGKEKLQGDLDQVRRGFEEMLNQFPVVPGATFAAESLNGIPATWCIPANASKSEVLLYLHGGGYVIGSPKAYGPMVSEIASRMKVRALMPDYRLAPEHPYPAALEDGVIAYRWLLDQGFAPHSIAVAGDSCGGGLIVATLVAIRDAGLPLPAGAFVISPWVDLSLSSESLTSKAAEDPLLDIEGLRGMAGAYLGATVAKTAGASPVYANLAGLPPLLIQVGSAEVLLDDANRLAANAGAAGVKVRLEVWPDMFHVWHGYAPILDEAGEALDDAAAFLNGLFAKQQLSAGAPA
jgi:epsilon-lactone hydrolase